MLVEGTSVNGSVMLCASARAGIGPQVRGCCGQHYDHYGYGHYRLVFDSHDALPSFPQDLLVQFAPPGCPPA
jgi:hypothetical protein